MSLRLVSFEACQHTPHGKRGREVGRERVGRERQGGRAGGRERER